MYSYIQLLLHMHVAFGASGISLIGAFGARWQLEVVFMGAVAGNSIQSYELEMIEKTSSELSYWFERVY